MLPQIKKVIPRSVKESIKTFERERRLRQAIEEILRVPPGEMPPLDLLARCESAWGNDGFRAVGGYVQEVARRAVTSAGPILEIGSGLTTLLLGLLAGRRGVQTWTLEHLPEYRQQIQAQLDRYGAPRVHNVLAPLRDHGAFSWYAPPDTDAMPTDFRLVIADGPPGDTKGGRYGLLPIMRSRLAPDVVILLDDAERPGEQRVLQQWKAEYQAAYELHPDTQKAWAVVHLAHGS